MMIQFKYLIFAVRFLALVVFFHFYGNYLVSEVSTNFLINDIEQVTF